MNQTKIDAPGKKQSSRWVVIVLVALALVVGAAMAAHKFGWLGTVSSLVGMPSVPEIAPPQPQTDLTQTATITPEKGGVLRAVDAYGVTTVLRIPPGAVTDPVEMTMTPFSRGATELQYGVEILPNIVFEKPVSLSFNWFLAKTLAHDNPYKSIPSVVMYDPEQVLLTPLDRAVIADNYLPAIITRAGMYGVTDVPEVVQPAASTVLAGEYSPLEQLNAALVLKRLGTLSRTERTLAQSVLDTVLQQSKPDVYDLYTALLLEKSLTVKTTFIQQAIAYGLFDGYLQYRCELKESTYEEVRNAMLAAAERGYGEVVKTCKREAEDRLLDRANLIDRSPNRPLIDAVEVLQQMQLMGLDDTGGRGVAVAKRLEADIIASLDSYAARRGQSTTEVTDGRVRANTASTDPLLKGNADLTKEMIGVAVLPLIGVDSFDEAGFKKFGKRMQEQIGGLNMMTAAMCDVVEQLGGEMGYGDVNITKECNKVRSGEVMDAVKVWREDVDEMAEGVGDIQEGKTPNSNWNDYTPSQSAADRLE